MDAFLPGYITHNYFIQQSKFLSKEIGLWKQCLFAFHQAFRTCITYKIGYNNFDTILIYFSQQFW